MNDGRVNAAGNPNKYLSLTLLLS